MLTMEHQNLQWRLVLTNGLTKKTLKITLLTQSLLSLLAHIGESLTILKMIFQKNKSANCMPIIWKSKFWAMVMLQDSLQNQCKVVLVRLFPAKVTLEKFTKFSKSMVLSQLQMRYKQDSAGWASTSGLMNTTEWNLIYLLLEKQWAMDFQLLEWLAPMKLQSPTEKEILNTSTLTEETLWPVLWLGQC